MACPRSRRDYNAGHDTEKIQRAAKAAHANGMEYHAWIPAMLQHGLDSTLYAVNRKGESAYSVQAYGLITNACARTKKVRRSSC